MTEPTRIAPEEVRQKVKAGSALLVCGYDDADKCRQVHLEGGIDYQDFTARIATIPKDQEIVFYCA